MKCDICGKEIESSSYLGATLCSSECFRANFWLDILKHSKNSKRYIRVNGTSYLIGEDNVVDFERGFYGALAIIRLEDKTVVRCRNLRLHGKVPFAFKELLPDNATFITDEILAKDNANEIIKSIPTFEELNLK